MNRIKWFVMPFLVSGLTAWTAAVAQANAEQKVEEEVEIESGNQDLEIERESSVELERDAEGMKDTEIKREAEVEARQPIDREARVEPRRPIDREAADLRQWADAPRGQLGDQERQPAPRMAERRPATQPSEAELERGQAALEPGARQRDLVDADIFIFEDAQGPRGYWTERGQARRDSGIYGYRDDSFRMRGGEIYGYREGEMRRAGVQGAVIEPTPTEADTHDWSEGLNLVDDNYIQNRDSFDNPGDFYTKEWKVSAPPLAAHPRFHTIYDNELTQQYYSAWHGSPVNWAPNMMVPAPMAEATNEGLLGDRQMVTYFTSWKDGPTTTTPRTFAMTPRGTFARGIEQGPVYGYVGPRDGRGMATRDGTLRRGGEALYWDDQDLLGGVAAGERFGGEVYGFVSPEAQPGDFVPGAIDEAEMNLNVPRSTGVSIYGVPTGEEQAEIRTEGEVYGYVGEEETEVKVEKKHKYKDKECDDDYDHEHSQLRDDDVNRDLHN